MQVSKRSTKMLQDIYCVLRFRKFRKPAALCFFTRWLTLEMRQQKQISIIWNKRTKKQRHTIPLIHEPKREHAKTTRRQSNHLPTSQKREEVTRREINRSLSA